MSEGIVRCFVALMIEQGAREAIAAGMQPLRCAVAGVKWVESINMHFTLKFLGEISPARVESARTGVARAVAGFSQFDMVLAGLGTFPATGAPKVVWLGLREGDKPMSLLASRVESELKREGFEVEKRGFTPHLTVGRVRDPGRAVGLFDAMKGMRGMAFGPSAAAQVCLMRSTLTPAGPVYSPVESWELDRQFSNGIVGRF